jgi:hypothetical protein
VIQLKTPAILRILRGTLRAVRSRRTTTLSPTALHAFHTILLVLAGSPFGPAAIGTVAQRWRGRTAPVDSRSPTTVEIATTGRDHHGGLILVAARFKASTTDIGLGS